ncbi:hypothetical protein CCAX7_32720 [Capsulimonas corticalis]|uniref:Uncharacterized protein n=1 Tax=Capsulimonas corticalis TaxID=2219043 RepID=A0A402D797_9BACT|nr:hypothetical protein [Capsulimonas corticalis]BDI31221.1 hypothetical protein CCAX7_32720 [Capsulimonas corticalis]
MATLFTAQCDRCDFNQTIAARTNYAYRLPEPPDVFLWTQFVWCGECRKIVQAEKLLTEEEIDAWLAGQWNRRIRLDGERYRQIIVGRQSPARCLTCGSVDIVAAKSGEHVATVLHGDCGGVVSLNRSGSARIEGGIDVYSAEGEFIVGVLKQYCYP